MSKRIVCAAIRNSKGRIITGARHYDGIMHTTLNYCTDHLDWEDPSQITQGFIDQRGNFLTREEAFDIAEANEQIIRLCGNEDKRKLCSENLY